jgi:DNA-binding winged helix-turn-helix (wHTH) protein
MNDESAPIYEFGEFRLDVGDRLLLRNGESVELTGKVFDMLVVLVGRAGHLVTKDMLLQAVWSGAFVEESNIPVNIHLLRKALGDEEPKRRFIATVPRQGYRFVAEVRTVEAREAARAESDGGSADAIIVAVRSASDEPSPPIESGSTSDEIVPVIEISLASDEPSPLVESKSASDEPSRPPLETTLAGGFPPLYAAHAIFACVLYALLYPIGLFNEVAYRVDELGPLAWRLAPWVFLSIFVSSGLSLLIDWKLTERGSMAGMVLSAVLIVLAGLLVTLAVGSFLPAEPVTEARISTYTAKTAYFKSFYYFVPLAIVYLVLPFHFVLALEVELRAGRGMAVLRLLAGKRLSRPPRGTLFLKVWWLALLLTITAGIALGGTAHLFDNLEPDANKNLFMQLVQWRLVVYFFLGCECIVWYHLALNSVRDKASR